MIRLFSLFLCLFVAIPPAAAALSAKAVRIGVHADKTRFVLELSAEPSYRVFTLPDPVRVVIDLPELEWQLESDQIPASKGMIETLRYGLFAQGTSRVVLDMKGPVGVKSVLVLPPQGGSARDQPRCFPQSGRARAGGLEESPAEAAPRGFAGGSAEAQER